MRIAIDFDDTIVRTSDKVKEYLKKIIVYLLIVNRINMSFIRNILMI